MRRFFIIFLLSLLFSACNETNVENKSTDNIINNFTTTSGQLEQDIPGVLGSEKYKRIKQPLEKGLGVESIQNGFDRFQIRIWESVEPFSGNLYVFKNLPDSEWNGEFYEYKYIQSQNGKMDSIVSKKSVLSSPKSGWDSFIKKLYQLDILTLPHWQAIPGYDALGNNEGGIAIELASRTKYRIYSYLTPQARKDDFPETKKVAEIVQVIKKEFN